jgi:hypothetical protein
MNLFDPMTRYVKPRFSAAPLVVFAMRSFLNP